MTDLKAMLCADSPTTPPRLTEGQRTLVVRAVGIAMGRHSDEAGDVKDLATRVVSEALGNWPADRSCYSCSYESKGHCRNFGADIPSTAALEAGCDKWQDTGAPF